IADLLANYESQYPDMKEKFRDVEEWRILALSNLGRYDQVENDLKAITEKNKGNPSQSDFIKELGLDFWKAAQEALAKNDQKGYLANAKLAATAYSYFEDMMSAHTIQPNSLTTTLSILCAP